MMRKLHLMSHVGRLQRGAALVMLGLAGLAGLVLAACSSTPDKPKPAQLLPVQALMDVRQVWKSSVGSVDFPLAVRVVGERAFVADSAGTVVAIDGKTGADIWRTALATPLSAGVGGDGRFTAVVSSSNELIVLDGPKVAWRTHLGALTLTAPLVAGARVFALSADQTVIAFDAATGRQLWLQPHTGDPLVLGQSGLLMAVGDTLVVGQGGHVVGMNPNNGATRWDVPVAYSRGTNEVERLADVVAGFSRNGDQVCVRAFQYTVSCIDAQLGKLVWTKPANGAAGLGGSPDDIFAVEGDGRLLAFRRSDGLKRWEVDTLRYRRLSAPLAVGKAVVLGDDAGNLHFFSGLDASALNRVNPDGTALAVTPVMVGKTLLVVSHSGGIFAFRSQ